MQDVDNLSKVPPYNTLDSETRRSGVTLFVPLKADPNVDNEITASHRIGDRHANGFLYLMVLVNPHPLYLQRDLRSLTKRQALSHRIHQLSLLIVCG